MRLVGATAALVVAVGGLTLAGFGGREAAALVGLGLAVRGELRLDVADLLLGRDELLVVLCCGAERRSAGCVRLGPGGVLALALGRRAGFGSCVLLTGLIPTESRFGRLQPADVTARGVRPGHVASLVE
jgi:hypothetical protein